MVTVPTVDRDVAAPRRCCNATAGGSPVMSSTFGAPVGNQQATGVRSDRFEVAALRLGVDGAEGQRRFAGSGDPRERDERIARRYDVDTPQIVDPRPVNAHARVDDRPRF